MMNIWNDIWEFTAVKPVVTIGIFDGVHSGHHYLLDKLKEKAAKIQGETVVVTLWPHPRVILSRDPENLRYLNTIEEKMELLENAGIDHLVIIPFTLEFSKLHSCEFVERYLVKKIQLHHLIIGFNHKFGKDREGDFKNLSECAEKFGFTLEQLKSVDIKGETISSSLIRDRLTRGDLEAANNYLGYDYFLQGEVVTGNHVGRKIGFPTANIRPHDNHKLIPGDGVYAVQLEHKGSLYNGMLNIGYRPTVEKDLYNKNHRGESFRYRQRSLW